MNFLTDLKPTTDDHKLVRVLIECMKGSIHKYEYDPRGVLTVVRDLEKRYRYPYNYGCVPGTLSGDGDPLDAIVISKESFVPLTVINCRVVGIIKMTDEGKEDNKLLCVPVFDCPKRIKLKKLLKYLNNYKYPNQSSTQINGVYNHIAAWDEIDRCTEK